MTQETLSHPIPGGILSSSSLAKFSGIDAEILMGGDLAPFSVMAMKVEHGMGAPAHISFHEDKVFVITEGIFLFQIGESRVRVAAGEHLFVAKGEIHSFSAINENSAKMTLISTPSHHDRFFQALSDLPLPHEQEAVVAICEEMDQTIVGPVVQLQCSETP